MREEKHMNIIEIGDNKYRILRFDPFDGGYVSLFVVKKVIPLLKAFDIGLDQLLDQEKNAAFEQMADMIMPILNTISRQELREFQEICLSHVEILRPAGFMRLYSAGVFNDDEVGHSTKTCLVLCYHAIRPLIEDFFGESGLDFSQIFKSITSRQPAKTSTNGSIGP